MGWSSISWIEYVWISFCTISTLLHSFLLYTILFSRFDSNKGFFAGSFFTLCVMQGVQEILMYFTANFINRMRKYNLTRYPIEYDSILVEWEHYWFVFLRNNLYLGHITIALNRLTVFLMETPFQHAKFWTIKKTICLLGSGYFMTITVRIATYDPKSNFTTTLDNKTGIFDYTLAPSVEKSDMISTAFFSVLATVVCLVAYVVTIYLARKNMLHITQKMSRELTLLRIAIATFLMLIPSTIRAVVQTIGVIMDYQELRQWASRQSTSTTDSLYAFQPWLLLMTCEPLRKKFYASVGFRHGEG